ncbi:MAG: hypothetical protein JXA99_12610 [Candidatus Lokiarchaeota archaeon]|nr:hypothetical protein [Candidatus Lokiarchaeota archaeon]
MKIKIKKIFQVLFIYTLLIYNLSGCISSVLSISTEQDEMNDVVCWDQSINKKSYSSEYDYLDIIEISINGQIINITFLGDLADFGDNCSLRLSFYEFFDLNSFLNLTDPYQYPFYDLYFGYTADIFGSLMYRLNDSETMYWNGTDFESEYHSITSNFTITQYSIIYEISIFAFNLSDITIFYAQSHYYNSTHSMADFAPEIYNWWIYDRSSRFTIPSYELFSLIGAICIVSIVLINKNRKNK